VTEYSKEESFNKLTPSRQSTHDHHQLKMEFQKNGVINISDYLDSNKDKEFNRSTVEEQKTDRNLRILMQLDEEENEDRSSSAGPKSGSRSQREETFEYEID
jgi:hypothetical protein